MGSICQALVTGGAGFIGSHLAHALVEDGCHVTVLDNLVTGNLKNLDAIKNKINFIKGDVRDLDIVLKAMKGCLVVFHQAAMVSVNQSVEQPIESVLINDVGTLNVLEAARRSGITRVVLASSSAIYGDDPQLPKVEFMTPKPLSPYAVQKLTNEHYAKLYQQLYGLDTVCLRYFNVYGPRQDPSSPYSGVISIFMSRATEKTTPVIFGDGGQTRDFVYVEDVVQANLLAASHELAPGQVFNVGIGRAIDIKTLWEKVAQYSHWNANPKFADSRPGDVRHSLANIEKISKQLGFNPSVDLSEGLKRTLHWYQRSISE